MLPEIDLVRSRTDKVWSPEDLRKQLPNRPLATIKVSLGRAIKTRQIIKIGHGEYAHPKYESSVPSPVAETTKSAPKPSKTTDWKETKYAALIHVICAGYDKDYRNHDSVHHAITIKGIYDLIRDHWEDKAITEFSKLLSKVWKELAESNPKVYGELATVTPKEIEKVIRHGGNYGGP